MMGLVGMILIQSGNPYQPTIPTGFLSGDRRFFSHGPCGFVSKWRISIHMVILIRKCRFSDKPTILGLLMGIFAPQPQATHKI